MDDPNIAIKLFASMGLGYLYQWILFGPQKIASWIAWSAMGASTLILYFWATPSAITDFQTNWRFALVGLVQFFLAAKGTGSSAAAAGAAPRSNTL